MDWISVEDRLPEPTELSDAPTVLITDGKEVATGWYEHNLEEVDERGTLFPEEMLWHDDGGYLTTDSSNWPIVTHWMPLPLPPKMMEWIEFKDEMPKHNQMIKVKSEGHWVGEGIFQDGKFVYSWVKGACFGSPTHWMPFK